MNYVFSNSVKILLGVLSLVVLFHLFLVFKVIPYDIAWGGRLQNDEQMYVFETVSILVNLFLMWVLLMKAGLVKFRFPDRVVNAILWVVFGIFLLNTLGNLFAKTLFEKQFAFLTAFISLLLWQILKNKTPATR